MSVQELLPLAVLFSSLVPGLAIFALPESWIGVRTTLNLFGAFAKLVGFSLIQIRYFHRSSFIFWQISSPGFSVPAWHQAP